MARYPGGKEGAGTFQRIINQIPPHDVYIEPFLGGGAILRHKRPAGSSIGIDIDADVINRFLVGTVPGAIAICDDAISWLESYAWQGNEFVYADPPYVRSTCLSDCRYRFDLSEKDHRRLLNVLLRLPCPVMISGYMSSLYACILSGWETDHFKVVTRGGTIAEEWLWMNYAAPQALHDYGGLGKDFTDRQRIKRKIARWKRKLSALPMLEREAMLQALNLPEA